MKKNTNFSHAKQIVLNNPSEEQQAKSFSGPQFLFIQNKISVLSDSQVPDSAGKLIR